MAYYLNFDLLIQPAEAEYGTTHPSRYRVLVLNSPVGQASGTFSLPLSEIELNSFLMPFARAATGSRIFSTNDVAAAKAFGGRLFAAVFSDEIQTCLRRSIEVTYSQPVRLRIRLFLEAVPELAHLPWEYLYDPSLSRFMALSAVTSVVRYLDLPDLEPLTIKLPLRVLAMISSPRDYPSFDVDLERDKLRTALSELERSGVVELSVLDAATPTALQRRLWQEDYHIFHFIGHGSYEQARDGMLVMEDENNRARLVRTRALGSLLRDHSRVRLAILSAYEETRASGSDLASGIAYDLGQYGLPAALGMRFEMTEESSITFAHEFYSALAHDSPVETALTKSRNAVARSANDLGWGAPVLYMGSTDGFLFDVKQVYPRGFVGASPANAAASSTSSPKSRERRINVWVEERLVSLEPLNVGESYTLNLMVGKPVAASLLRGSDAGVPDSDVPESGLETHWVIASDTVELRSLTLDVSTAPMNAGASTAWAANFSLHIPWRGDSATRSLRITPRVAVGACLEVMIFVQTEQYRRFTVNLAVEESPGVAAPEPHLSVATVSDDCANAPLAHHNLRTTHEWTTPSGRISISVIGADKAFVTGDAGAQPVNGSTDWQGNQAMVAGPMLNVRSSAEKFRAKWERYLNDIDPTNLNDRLNHFSPQYDWSALRDDSDPSHQQEWQRVAVSQELRDLAYDGHRLYESFFPLGSDLRSWLDALRPAWRISITWQPKSGAGWIPHVPWGLMYQPTLPVASQPIDPMGFLGLRYRIDYTAHPVNAKSKALGRVEDTYGSHFLYWGDQPQDLTGEEARWQHQQWCGWPNQSFVPPTPPGVDPKATLLSLLDTPTPTPAAVLYLFCQCSVGDGNNPVLRFGNTLQPSDVVRRTEIGTQPLTDQPLVFANACTTAAADPYMANELETVFFQRDCRAYIGTESKVPIQLASRFASAFFNFFYRKVDSEPMAAGEAVVQTRLLLWTQYKNIGGLFYNYVNLYELFMAQDAEVLALRR